MIAGIARGAAGFVLMAGLTSSHAADMVPACRLDGALADTVATTLKSASQAYVALGKPLLFDRVVVNPIRAVDDPRALRVYVVTDASKDGVDSRGCAKAPVRKDEPLDDLSVRGGCLVAAVDRMEIRCSAEAIRIFGDLRQRPGRAHPALLYVLAHELGHLYQKRVGEYVGRVDRIDLRADAPTQLQALRDSCDPALTRREEEADALSVQVLARLLPAPPYREPALSEQGSVYWGMDQLYLAAIAWQRASLEREFISRPRVHPSCVPTEFPVPEWTVEQNAKRFVCEVMLGRQGVVLYPSKSTTHPPIEQRMRKVAEALRLLAATLPTAGSKQEFRSVAILQEQLGPVFAHIYRETGVYLEAVRSGVCTRVNGNAPTAGCR